MLLWKHSISLWTEQKRVIECSNDWYNSVNRPVFFRLITWQMFHFPIRCNWIPILEAYNGDMLLMKLVLICKIQNNLFTESPEICLLKRDICISDRDAHISLTSYFFRSFPIRLKKLGVSFQRWDTSVQLQTGWMKVNVVMCLARLFLRGLLEVKSPFPFPPLTYRHVPLQWNLRPV